MSNRDRLSLAFALSCVLALAATTAWKGGKMEKRLDRLEASTNLLYQWSPYKAHAEAKFDHIDRTNKP